MDPLSLFVAVAFGLGVYYVFSGDDKCIDDNLSAEERKVARTLLASQPAKDATAAQRSHFVKNLMASAKAAKLSGHPKLAACFAAKAKKLAVAPKKKRTTPFQRPAGEKPMTTKPKGNPMGKATVGDPKKAPPTGTFGLPGDGGPARDAEVLALIKSGKIQPWDWKPVDCSKDGHSCTVFVSDQPLQLADGAKRLIFTVMHPTAERIAMYLGGAFLPTKLISDLSYEQADHKLAPAPRKYGPTMDDTLEMAKHSAVVLKQIGGRKGLIRDGGKDWITTNKLDGAPSKAANYGWHAPPGSAFYAIAKYKTAGGAKYIQPRSTFHSTAHTDYSQNMRLVKSTAIVDGKTMPLDALMRHPKLSKLVSDEGPIRVTRHPAVVGVA